jgi:hypothetical protein
MPSLIGTTGGELGDEVQEGGPTPKHLAVPAPPQHARVPSHQFDADVTIPGNSMQVTSGAQSGIDADNPAAQSIDTASVSPLGNRDSEEEPGAFDDSHLQVDQPKKKKKKSKKPKSKRGLVMTFLVIQPLLI